MPFCPACRMEYREGVSRCADCDRDLVDRLPDVSEDSRENTGEEFVPLPDVEGGVYAEMLKDALEEMGISCFIHSDGLVDTLGITGTGPVRKWFRIFVPKSQFQHCLDVFHSIVESGKESPD